ncbi:ABC transporter ATP-binding protein [Ktedonobacteria bacterium brp13]|nr:ABC transporter ATP-binding protein [Ktedonobacteria bacterium brp13]
MQESIVTCDNLLKIYKTEDLEVVALQGLDLEVARGEMIALVGASGSGKTTLMNILGGLDAPSAGHGNVAGYDLTRLDEEQRTRYRNVVVGYLWQQSGRNLLPDLSVAANVDLPQMLNGISAKRSAQRTHTLLELVGLAGHAKKRPFQLSGGEQQRVAIAVALANQPELLLADEPTGEVDSQTAQELLDMLRQINTELDQTIILVTHDTAVAQRVDRTLAIRDGRTSTETIRRTPETPAEIQTKIPAAVSSAPAETAQPASELVATLTSILEQHHLRNQLEIHFAGDHLELWPVSTQRQMPSGGTSSVIGLSLDSHRELVLVDRVGRLQLPREALELIPTNGRAEVQVAGDRVILWPFTNGKERAQETLIPAQRQTTGTDGVQ